MSTRRRNVRTKLDDELEAERLAEEAEAKSNINIQPETQPLPPKAGTEQYLHQQQKTSATHKEEEEEDDDDDDELFEDTYKRSTFYIKRTNEPRLKKLIKKLKKRGEHKPKYVLMEEALEYLFNKYE